MKNYYSKFIKFAKRNRNTNISIRIRLTFAFIFFALSFIFLNFSEQINLGLKHYQLTKAVRNGDVDLYNKYGFNKDLSEYTNAELEIQRHIMVEILRKYIQESGTAWPDKEVENGMVLFSILLGGSPEFGGIGVADTDEGYELLQLAIQKYTAEYPNSSDSTLIAEKQENGAVLVGMRLSIQ